MSKLSRENQKQKMDLLFKYVKSIDSYQQAHQDHQNQCKEALQKFYRRVSLQQKQKCIGIRSKVLQWTIKNPQSKKRVQFSDQIMVNNCSTLKEKGDKLQNQYKKQRVKDEINPQQLHRQLQDIQKSIFSIFKIKAEPKDSKIIDAIPEISSLMLQSNIDSRKNSQERQRIFKDGQKKIARSSSEHHISSRKFNHQSQSSSRIKISSQVKGTTNKGTQTYKMSRNMSESGLSRGISQSYENIIKRGNSSDIFSKNSSCMTRSDSFWKQQNNLMVEIFRNKLTTSTKR